MQLIILSSVKCSNLRHLLVVLKKYFSCSNRKMSQEFNNTEIPKSPININGIDIDKNLTVAGKVVTILWTAKTMKIIFVLCTKIPKMSGYLKGFEKTK